MLCGQLPRGGSGLHLGCAAAMADLEHKGLAGFETGWHLATAGPLPVVEEDVPLGCGASQLLSLFAHLIPSALVLLCAMAASWSSGQMNAHGETNPGTAWPQCQCLTCAHRGWDWRRRSRSSGAVDTNREQSWTCWTLPLHVGTVLASARVVSL